MVTDPKNFNINTASLVAYTDPIFCHILQKLSTLTKIKTHYLESLFGNLMNPDPILQYIFKK
jgi:hypothetical protein